MMTRPSFTTLVALSYFTYLIVYTLSMGTVACRLTRWTEAIEQGSGRELGYCALGDPALPYTV